MSETHIIEYRCDICGRERTATPSPFSRHPELGDVEWTQIRWLGRENAAVTGLADRGTHLCDQCTTAFRDWMADRKRRRALDADR